MFAETDRKLLKLAKSLLARLPISQLDALVVQELGKEISGAGMDYAVIGRTDIRGIPNPDHIAINKLAVLRLTKATAGNGVGIGVADYMPRNMANQLDLKAIYENAITAAVSEKARIPIVLPTEEEVIKATVVTSWAAEPKMVRYCQIRNTLDLDEIFVSEALIDDLGVMSATAFKPLEFDNLGRLFNAGQSRWR